MNILRFRLPCTFRPCSHVAAGYIFMERCIVRRLPPTLQFNQYNSVVSVQIQNYLPICHQTFFMKPSILSSSKLCIRTNITHITIFQLIILNIIEGICFETYDKQTEKKKWQNCAIHTHT